MIYSAGFIYFHTYTGGIGITVSHIVKTVKSGNNSINICNDVSLEIRPAELVAIIGGSGAGKTTLMNAICGYNKPTSGKVVINGEDLYEKDTYEALKSVIGYVPQQDIVYDNLTLFSMLNYAAKLRLPDDTSPAERERRVREVIDMVELSSKADTMIRRLSGGQKKRASIAVELLSDPQLFFLDEPASGLDPGTERNLMRTLKNMTQSGKTVILVTHSTLNLQDCDKILFMGRGGNLCYSGNMESAKRFFKIDMTYMNVDFKYTSTISGFKYLNFLRDCCTSGTRMVYDEQMEDGSIVHSFARRIAYDPVKNRNAIAVAVLSITDPDQGATYATIARALAADYYNIYYVDLETEKFIEYSSTVGEEELAVERHGKNFFAASRKDTMTRIYVEDIAAVKRDTMVRIYEEDREPFLTGFTKKNIINELDTHGSFFITYRLIDSGKPVYVNMKVMRMKPDNRHIIIGISIVDSQMKQQELHEAIHREEAAYARIMALSGGYLGLYTVDPDSNGYFEYVASNEFKELGLNKTGTDFFLDGIVNGKKVVYEEDLPYYIENFNKKKIMEEIKENGSFMLRYRMKIKDEPMQVLLKIVPLKEENSEKLIVGVRQWKTR